MKESVALNLMSGGFFHDDFYLAILPNGDHFAVVHRANPGWRITYTHEGVPMNRRRDGDRHQSVRSVRAALDWAMAELTRVGALAS